MSFFGLACLHIPVTCATFALASASSSLESKLMKRMYHQPGEPSFRADPRSQVSPQMYLEKHYQHLREGKEAKAGKSENKYLALRDQDIDKLHAIHDHCEKKYWQIARRIQNLEIRSDKSRLKNRQWRRLASALYHDGPFESIQKPSIEDIKVYDEDTPEKIERLRKFIQYKTAEDEAIAKVGQVYTNLAFSLDLSEKRLDDILSKARRGDAHMDQIKVDRAILKHAHKIKALLKCKYKNAMALADIYQASMTRRNEEIDRLEPERDKLYDRREMWRSELASANANLNRYNPERNFYTHYYESTPSTAVGSPNYFDDGR